MTGWNQFWVQLVSIVNAKVVCCSSPRGRAIPFLLVLRTPNKQKQLQQQLKTKTIIAINNILYSKSAPETTWTHYKGNQREAAALPCRAYRSANLLMTNNAHIQLSQQQHFRSSKSPCVREREAQQQQKDRDPHRQSNL